MAKGYIDDISDFIMAFLKSSKIQDQVKSLASCINDLIKTFSSLSIVTQQLNDRPNLTSFMGVIGAFNQIWKDSSNNLICGNARSDFSVFINKFVQDPKIGNGDFDRYLRTIIDIVKNRYTRIFFELVKAADLYRKREFYKSGERIGDLFYNLVLLRDLSDDTKDFDGYNQIVGNDSVFQNDANTFRQRFSFCLNSLQKVVPDINNFYGSTIRGIDVVPTVNDLLKSMFETNQIIQCFDGVSQIMTILQTFNYNYISPAVTGSKRDIIAKRENSNEKKEKEKKYNNRK